MPIRPPVHRPAGSGAEQRARVERDRQRLMLRPSAVERGYDEQWRIVRAGHLAWHPLCSVEGCGEPATDVDHVQSIADHPELRLEPGNLRSLCKQHHSQRTARDQGFARTGELNSANAPLRGVAHPSWLRRSIVPVTLVAGPHGAGKSTLVQQRASSRDLVLDLVDIVATLSGQRPYEAPLLTWRDKALRWRNARLSLLSYVSHWPHVWLIVNEPRGEWRQWWRDKLGVCNVIVLETDAETCLFRIHVDQQRSPAVRVRQSEAIAGWWQAYQRHDDDIVIRPNRRPTTGRGASAGAER